jgi:glycosyltransferase involved in cell wall biosynthesis
VKIDHITFSKTGGAGIVAQTLVKSQRALGHDVEILTVVDSDLRSQPLRSPGLTIAAGIDEYLVSSHSENTLFSPLRGNLGALDTRKIRSDSIIHLHWMPGVIDQKSLKALLDSGRKVVWTLHDMNPFTGGCHHSHDCEQFTQGCSSCPQARTAFHRLVSINLQGKLLDRKYSNLRVVSPTSWMLEQASRSTVFRDQQNLVIANPIDDGFFAETHQLDARKKLGIPLTNFVGVVIAKDLSDPNKNIDFVLRALEQVSLFTQMPLTLLLIGKNGASYSSSTINLHSAGALTVTDIPLIACAADVLLSGSIAESAGMTLAECAAMGIPSLALENGGTSSLISDGVNGLLAQNLESFVSQIISLVNEPTKLMLLKSASKQNAELYGAIRVAKQYVKIYDSMS